MKKKLVKLKNKSKKKLVKLKNKSKKKLVKLKKHIVYIDNHDKWIAADILVRLADN